MQDPTNELGFLIMTRKQVEVNNDPQRRCYNGCHFSTEKVWTDWSVVGYRPSKEEGEARIKGWQDWDTQMDALNKTKIVREYKLVPREV
jgi:hypothetical protein